MIGSLLRQVKNFIPQRSPLRLLWHKAKAFLAALLYGFPARRLTVIGITGTDGKTTTVGMTTHILVSAGVPVGALSTAFFQVRKSVEWNASQKTSPSPFLIQKFLRRLVSDGCTHLVLECSSHGLVQGRNSWTWPKVAAITNTSAEHLDYHGTMEQYRKDKGILFHMLRGKGTKVLNRNDETYRMYSAIPSEKTVVYSVKGVGGGGWGAGEYLLDANNVQTALNSIHATIELRSSEKSLPPTPYPLTLNLPGVFNLENALCAIGCALAVGVPLEKTLEALKTFGGVPGRMERIDAGQPFTVYVDFTVTPISYERTLEAARAQLQPGGRLLVLTGSCGDRMKEKRPLVGEICSRFADVLVVANEDPYTEDPEKIIDEVFAGIDQKKTEAHRIFDRQKAIEFLFKLAKPGDIVMLCGKGSDTTMWVKEGQIPWNEREIARTMLRTMVESAKS